jgi:S-DNA-T family DNA segregation ATPase FtsK/SpoIIIE
MTTPSGEGRPVDGGRGSESAAPIGPDIPDGPVLDAELLTYAEKECVARRFPETSKALVPCPPAELAHYSGEVARRAAIALYQATRAVWRSGYAVHARSVLVYRARKAPRDLVRLTWFALLGHAQWMNKAWTFFTYGDLRTDVRAARLAGDAQARRAAQEMIRADSRARWARFGMFVERMGKGATAAGVAALVLWLINSMMSREQMWPWLAGLYEVLAKLKLWTLATMTTPAVATLVGIGWLVAAVYEGRGRSPGAGFLVRPDRDDADSWVDERMISQALAHLGIAPLDKFFKDGGLLVYTVPARVDGNGTYAQVRLPLGVTADMVADRRARLAANLGRAKLETWPTEGAEAGQLDLWVADKGKLGQGAGPWPLLHDGEVDFFDGVPFGRSQRGQVLKAPIVERNYMIGGQPGQGKSSAGRTLCLGCVLDPTVELRVYVFASNPDFDPFRPRLSAYVKGDDDEAIGAGLGALRELREEVTRRGKLLERHGAAKVTRKLASNIKGLHPVVVIFDECHEMFEHGVFGGEAGSLAIKVVKKARKCGITLLFLTQSPTAASIPKDLTRNCSNGVAFAVADQVANDGLLGSGTYRQGIRATELRPGEDRGTAVTTGLTANRFELVNTFYIAFDEARDDVSPVIARAMALLDEHGRLLPTSEPEGEGSTEPEPDHLADIHTVTRGETRVRTQIVLRRLAELNPDEYADWSFQDLAEALTTGGITARKSDGVMVVRAADVVRALTERDQDNDDADG